MNDTRKNIYVVIAVVAGGVVGLRPASAQEAGKVMIDVADCIKLEAPEARLACYESRVAAVFGQRAAQAAARPVSPAPQAAAVVRIPEPEPAPASAVTGPVQSRDYRKARREEDERAAADAAANDVFSRVKELREVVPNAWQITLENGQVWRQTVSKRYGLRPGQEVKIYSTRWGNASRLSAEEINGYIQVERVR